MNGKEGSVHSERRSSDIQIYCVYIFSAQVNYP